MADVSKSEWDRIWSASREISELFPDGVAFIGGVAVYGHTAHRADLQKLAAFSHDSDFVIARADFMDLRDIEVVASNRRLSKHEFVREGMQFDVYEEGSSGLIVPVAEILAGAATRGGLRVAAPEHLMALKLEAYGDRKGSGKGDKDASDAYRILLAMEAEPLVAHRLAYLTESHIGHLEEIRKSPAAARLSGGNLHEAAALNERIDPTIEEVKALARSTREGPGDRRHRARPVRDRGKGRDE